MIRLLVIEHNIEVKKQILTHLAAEKDVEIVGVATNGIDALDRLEQYRPDAVIVDAEVPRMNGLASLVGPSISKRPYLVVIAASDRYAIEAFEVGAIDYLLREASHERFRMGLRKLRNIMDKESQAIRKADFDSLVHQLKQYTSRVSVNGSAERIPVKISGRMRFLSVQAIEYVEADANYTNLHMITGEVLHSTDRISELAQRLPQTRFLRIRRSTIVNREYIREARAHKDKSEIVMNNGKKFRPGSTYRKTIKEELLEDGS